MPPKAILARVARTNPYVGNANSLPASRRRDVRCTDTAEDKRQLDAVAPSAGAAEVIASTPAAIDTATVSAVHEKRSGSHRPDLTEVLLRDDIGAPAAGIGPHRLPIGQDDEHEQGGDRQGDRDQQLAPRRGRAEQDRERGLSGVSDRREGIGGEDRERHALRQQRRLDAARHERAPNDDALDEVEGSS